MSTVVTNSHLIMDFNSDRTELLTQCPIVLYATDFKAMERSSRSQGQGQKIRRSRSRTTNHLRVHEKNAVISTQ